MSSRTRRSRPDLAAGFILLCTLCAFQDAPPAALRALWRFDAGG
jgi:hypothetical protein